MKFAYVLAPALLLASPAFAAQTITGIYTGAPATTGSTQYSPSEPYYAYAGSAGYSAAGDAYTFNATITGGSGGSIVGTDTTQQKIYIAGAGGTGVNVATNGKYTTLAATFTGGTYIGGAGGQATGTAADLQAGAGGAALIANASTVNITAGSFIGGNAGSAIGTATTLNNTVSGGSGVLAMEGDINIYGGTFSAGIGATPTPGTNGFDIDAYSGLITIYGTNFLVNGQPVSLPHSLAGSGTLSVLLQDNQTVTTMTYYASGLGPYYSGLINLIAVPEPASLALLSIPLLLTRHRRRN